VGLKIAGCQHDSKLSWGVATSPEVDGLAHPFLIANLGDFVTDASSGVKRGLLEILHGEIRIEGGQSHAGTVF
jgi:hypothetical protein